MSVIVRGLEVARYSALPDDDPKKNISQAWLMFLAFHYRSAAVRKSGKITLCVAARYGDDADHEPVGKLRFPRFDCCTTHRELGEYREKIIALLDEHGFNKPETYATSDRQPAGSYDPLTSEWWAFHGFSWSVETPIVMTEDEAPEN